MVAHSHLVEYANVALTNAGPWHSCVRCGFAYHNKQINKQQRPWFEIYNSTCMIICTNSAEGITKTFVLNLTQTTK